METEKALGKIPHPFLTKTLERLGMEGNFLNLIKGIYEKPTAYNLNGQRLEDSPLR